MPGMDGYDVCKHLKADERTKDIPVIFLSALNETVDKVRAFKIGGVDYITKPFQAEEVLARVKTHLELSAMRMRLQAQNTQLNQEILEHKRTKAALQHAKERAEAANQAKSTFLSNMSHELRSPLTAILGFAQVMDHSMTLPPEHQEHVDIIRRSGEHLLTLINQVLELSKIEAGRITLDESDIDLYRLLADVKDMFRLRMQEKHLQFLVKRSEQLPQYLRADEVKLRQVLINLLNNALKFTEKGEVTLRIVDLEDASRSHISHLKFEIEDTGPGIAPEEIDGLFEAFVQTESGRQAREGTGLGLPISRKFIQLMGGDIHVESTLGHGTLFRFEVQARIVEATDAEPHLPFRRALALEADQPRYRMLIVDDRPTNRQLVVKLLAPFGFELREATNGEEALELCEVWRPHLIWMDMRMPIMDGYEATKRIREQEPDDSQPQVSTLHSHIKIIALTASSFKEEQEKILAAGCDDYLRKPFRQEELLQLLQKHLGLRFVYEEDEQTTQREVAQQAEEITLPAPEVLTALPAAWLSQLKQGVEEVDVQLLLSVIEQIREHDAAIADALAQLVENFEYDELLARIQQR